MALFSNHVWNPRPFLLLVLGLSLLMVGGCCCLTSERQGSALPRTVVWVNAYHPELEWSAGIQDGIESVFRQRMEVGDLELKAIHLDTKNRPGDAYAMEAARRAFETITRYQPDLIIAGDDATANFLVQEYYAGSDLPVVFCGVNFNAGKYGFFGADGAPNVTGILEVPPVDRALDAAAKYARGDRIGYITYDDLSEKANLDGIVNELKIDIPAENVAYVSTVDAWNDAYADLQSRVDVIIMGSANFMQGWDWAEAHQSIINQTHPGGAIPVTYNSWTIDIALLAYSKRASEQGEWAARAALEILFGGKAPVDIPFGRNRQADLLLNQTLAERLGIQFDEDDIAVGNLLATPIN